MNLFYIIALLVTAFSKPVEDVTDNTNSIETSLESEQNTTSEYPAYLPKFPKHISKISTGSKPEINFIYHGGSIIRNVNTFVILINRPNFDFEIINYYKNVYQTDVFEFLNEEYSTKNYVIGKGGYLGSITKTVNSNVYEDGDIQKWLDDWIQDKSIPIPDANTFFAIHTNNIDIIKFGATSCKNYCGYHGTHFYNKTLYTYGIVPDQEIHFKILLQLASMN
ncbi:hypothetical protein BC833DRAFT_661682 [Globomyces pollinis-pini]|nr:hypothetical protein BC833DRAFT_661682 [Globomyces pollinis-pini]